MAKRAKPIRLLIIVAVLGVCFGFARLAMREISTGPRRTLIEKDLTQALGLDVTLDELEMALLPTPHLHAEGIRVANPPGSEISLEVEGQFECSPASGVSRG